MKNKHNDDLNQVCQMIGDNIVKVIEGEGYFFKNGEIARLPVSNTMWQELKRGVEDIVDFTAASETLDFDTVEERLFDYVDRDVIKNKKIAARLITKLECEWHRLRKHAECNIL